MKPKLLVLELWGLGDLVIATPFLRAAAERYQVTLLAKPYAEEMRPRFWPEVEVIPFNAPWTAFHHKYLLWRWPWRHLLAARRQVMTRHFDYGVSARWDPRDHLLLRFSGARERIGFQRLNSGRYLTRSLPRPAPTAHRYESWREIGRALGLELPERSELFVGRSGTGKLEGRETEHLTPALSPFDPSAPIKRGEGERLAGSDGSGTMEPKAQAPSSWPSPPTGAKGSETQNSSPQPSPRLGGERELTEAAAGSRMPALLIHTGARLPLRVWPLEHFQTITARLRQKGYAVQIICDPDQQGWWRSQGEQPFCPRTVTELIAALDQASAFFGNDSGPGHLAAACGLPTFTLFGPQLHEWFAPLHPASEVMEGKACPYKPCSDYCRFAEPFCLRDITVDEVWPRLEAFVTRNLKKELKSDLPQ